MASPELSSSHEDHSVEDLPDSYSRRDFLKLSAAVAAATVLDQPVVRAAESFAPPNDSIPSTHETAPEGPTGNPYFDRTYHRGRPEDWGPFIRRDVEQYANSPDGEREVAYFEKSRMEITHPEGNKDSLWYVTNGLLSKELITGKRQIGDAQFESWDPADIQIAGDPGAEGAPTYTTFRELLDERPLEEGQFITHAVDAEGSIRYEEAFTQHGVIAGKLDTDTNHRVASVFESFRQKAAEPYEGNVDYIIGKPIAEAYWTVTTIDGKPGRRVLVQPFERRVLTYTPDNPPEWQVEMGNVGLHYNEWVQQSREQEDAQELIRISHTMEQKLLVALNQKETCTPIFDTQYFQSLPQHFDEHCQNERWWMGAYLPSTALLYHLDGDTERAYEYIKKGWEYKKESFGSEIPVSTTDPEVFHYYEYLFALRLMGKDLQQKDPSLVLDMLSVMEQAADGFTSQEVPGNDANTLKSNSYGETNAGIAAFLMGMAAIKPNHDRREEWIQKAHNYANGAFAVNELIEGNPVTTAVEEGSEVWIYNHGFKNAAYTKTTEGQLGLGMMYAQSAGLTAGKEFRHNSSRAHRSVMNHIDANNRYTLPENNQFFGMDEYMLPWMAQDYNGYNSDIHHLRRLADAIDPVYHPVTQKPDVGIYSEEFQASVDPNFLQDAIRLFEANKFQRMIQLTLSLQLRAGKQPEINGKPVKFFTDTT